MNPFSIESYLEGIRRAHREGLITFGAYGVVSPDVMEHSNHIPWEVDGVPYDGVLSMANTRSLYDVIKTVLVLFKDTPPVDYLEIGPGAGNACYETYALAKSQAMDVRISAASLTPINPYMPLLLSGNQLRNVLTNSPKFEISRADSPEPLWHIPTKEAFRLQTDNKIKIFGKLSEPYIHHQYIGSYPGQMPLGDRIFDIVYDMYGPLHRESLDPIQDAYSRLSDKGVLFFVFHPKYTPGKIMLDGARKKSTPLFNATDLVLVDLSNASAMVAKENSRLSLLLRNKWNLEPQTLSTHNMIVFMRRVLQEFGPT